MKCRFWKNISFLLMFFLLAAATAAPCLAQENTQVIATYTEDLGNGITAVITITQTVSRSTINQTKSGQYYSSGQYIGQAALAATFFYNGSTSQATGASGVGSGANGWRYGNQSTWTSGSTAYLSATLSKGGASVPVNLSLSCDENGVVS